MFKSNSILIVGQAKWKRTRKNRTNERVAVSAMNTDRQADRQTDRQTHMDTNTNTSIAATATHTIVLAVPVYNSDCCTGHIA